MIAPTISFFIDKFHPFSLVPPTAKIKVKVINIDDHVGIDERHKMGKRKLLDFFFTCAMLIPGYSAGRHPSPALLVAAGNP